MSSPYIPMEPARFEQRPDGTLYSTRFEDVYSSAHGALEQARHVFLAGNGFPGRWRGQKDFTIVETGFGAGLNFLATWQQWRASAPADARLHFISVEKHPFRREDLARIYAPHPELAAFTKPLFLQWPALLPGFHRLHFERDDRLTLTLLFGDAVQMLAQLDASADAFMLDGFAPARNADMWSAEVFAQIGRLAAKGATCATYTVAANVRAGLTAAGFAIEKRPGFASKRDMLAGTFTGNRTHKPASPARRAIVIGAGLAGTTCAERLVRRGWAVELFESHPGPAQEASGNPAGLIRPVVSADWNTHSRFTTAGFLYTSRHYKGLAGSGFTITQGSGGVIQFARNEERHEKLQRVMETFRLPPEFGHMVSSEEAAERVGSQVIGSGVWFPEAVWATPESMCRANLAGAGGAVATRFGTAIAAIERRGGDWHVLDAAGHSLGQAPVLVLANAHQALSFSQTKDLPLRRVRGQVSRVPAHPDNPLKIAVCGDGYVTPAIDGTHWIGATFNEGVFDPEERAEDHEANLRRAKLLAPAFGAHIEKHNDGPLHGRVAFRTMAKDRLPVVGPLGEEGLFACLALGSRGMTWSALAAELLASQVSGEPLPVEKDLIAGLDPRRFAAQP